MTTHTESILVANLSTIMQLFHITLFYLFLTLKFAKWISDVILMGICDFEHYYCTAMLNGPLTYNVLFMNINYWPTHWLISGYYVPMLIWYGVQIPSQHCRFP